MSEKVEGTIVLDGLIEGALASPKMEELLREWVDRQGREGLRFSLAVDGGSFSILASNRPVESASLGPDPAARIEQAFRDLQALLPPEGRMRLFSTLRSTEYAKGREVQTLYVVAPDGSLRSGQRTVEAQTSAPPQPVTMKHKLRMAGTGVLVALVVLAASSIFVDYRGMLRNIFERFTPLNPEALKVETGEFAPYFTVEKKSAADGGRAAAITLKRTKDFPLSVADCQRLLDANAGMGLPSRLAVEALARGYVRCEVFGRDNEFLGATLERIAPLREKETFDLVIPMPPNRRPARVVVTY